MIRVGLRFHRSDAGLLQLLADRIRARELPAHAVQTFAAAADAATTGEPLIVLCEHPSEAQVMADGYVRFGVRRPAIEDLTGHRPAR